VSLPTYPPVPLTTMSSTKPLKVLVTGPTGTTGREVVKTLLDRGHHVTGLSRNPESWGTHLRYTPLKGTQVGDIDALIEAVEGHDVVVSAFAPSHSRNLTTYIGLVEGAWRIKEAVKRCRKKPYLLYVGGAGQ
jgi:putative NADH-flavin reductase